MRLCALRRTSSHAMMVMANSARNARNRISAIPGTAAAMSVKAKMPDTEAIARKIMANLSICISLERGFPIIGSARAVDYRVHAAAFGSPSVSR